LDFWSDVKALDVSIEAVTLPLSQSLSLGNAVEGLGALQEANGESRASLRTRVHRQMRQIGLLNADGSESLLSAAPTSFSEYPVFSGGNSGGTFSINFGQTLFYIGNFLPKVDVLMANGLSNSAGGGLVGFVNFASYGSISMFGEYGYCLGSVSIAERYSEIQMQGNTFSVGQTITLNCAGLTEMDKYTLAYFGVASSPVSYDGENLLIVVPQNAKSGPLRIESQSPQFDFLLTEPVFIS
jgi:hypothetical protein